MCYINYPYAFKIKDVSLDTLNILPLFIISTCVELSYELIYETKPVIVCIYSLYESCIFSKVC